MKNKSSTKPKHVIQRLKKISERLKPVKYSFLEKFSRPFWQDAEGTFHNEQAAKEEPQRRMVTQMIQEREGNHKRRIKKAFNIFGEQGAIAYLAAFQTEEDPIIKFT